VSAAYPELDGVEHLFDPDEIDEVAVLRALQGDRTVGLTAAEFHAAVWILTARQIGAELIGVWLGRVGRTVVRARAQRPLGAAA
jgi:hypothetical protein